MDNIDWPHHVLDTGPIAPTEGVDDLASAATRDSGAALDFVRQAAEVIRGIEDRAYETEQHAQGIAKEATEKLQLAEKRIEELEACIQGCDPPNRLGKLRSSRPCRRWMPGGAEGSMVETRMSGVCGPR